MHLKKNAVSRNTLDNQEPPRGPSSDQNPHLCFKRKEHYAACSPPWGWGWRQREPPSQGWFVVEGYLVAGGGMMHVQGGIPFPLNNLPCQCGPNLAHFFFFLQGWVLSLSRQRESLPIVSLVKTYHGRMFSTQHFGSCHGFYNQNLWRVAVF